MYSILLKKSVLIYSKIPILAPRAFNDCATVTRFQNELFLTTGRLAAWDRVREVE